MIIPTAYHGSSPRCWPIEAVLRRVVALQYRQDEQETQPGAAGLGLQKAQGLASNGAAPQTCAATTIPQTTAANT